MLIISSIYKIWAKSINNVWTICWYRRIVLWSLACYKNRWVYETPKNNLQMLLFYNEATHSLIIVKQAKGFHDFFLGISLSHLGCHHLQKLFKVDCPTPILINISYHFFDFLLPKQFMILVPRKSVGKHKYTQWPNKIKFYFTKACKFFGRTKRAMIERKK